MSRNEIGKPPLIAELEEFDLALENLQQIMIQPDEISRSALLRLQEDAEDLERLDDMAARRPSDIGIFDVLRLDGNEQFHSNFLSWLLNPKGSHGLGGYFLREFLRCSRAPRTIPASAIDSTTVNREHSIGGTAD